MKQFRKMKFYEKYMRTHMPGEHMFKQQTEFDKKFRDFRDPDDWSKDIEKIKYESHQLNRSQGSAGEDSPSKGRRVNGVYYLNEELDQLRKKKQEEKHNDELF